MSSSNIKTFYEHGTPGSSSTQKPTFTSSCRCQLLVVVQLFLLSTSRRVGGFKNAQTNTTFPPEVARGPQVNLPSARRSSRQCNLGRWAPSRGRIKLLPHMTCTGHQLLPLDTLIECLFRRILAKHDVKHFVYTKKSHHRVGHTCNTKYIFNIGYNWKAPFFKTITNCKTCSFSI